MTLAAAGLVGAIALAGCSNSDDMSGMPGMGSSASPSTIFFGAAPWVMRAGFPAIVSGMLGAVVGILGLELNTAERLRMRLELRRPSGPEAIMKSP